MAKITPQKGNVLNIWLKTVEDCPSVIHDGAHCLSRASPSLHLPLREFSGTQTALAQRNDLYCLFPELVSGCPYAPPPRRPRRGVKQQSSAFREMAKLCRGEQDGKVSSSWAVTGTAEGTSAERWKFQRC